MGRQPLPVSAERILEWEKYWWVASEEWSMSIITTGLAGPNADPTQTEDDLILTEELAGDRILLPLTEQDEQSIRSQIAVAVPLARKLEASIWVINPVTLPEQLPYEMSTSEGTPRKLLGWALNTIDESNVPTEGIVRFSRQVAGSVIQATSEHEIDLVVLPADSGVEGVRNRDITRQRERGADCDVVVIDTYPHQASRTKILVAIGGGPHSGLAVDVATSLVSERNVWVEILHVIDSDASTEQQERAEQFVTTARDRFDTTENVDTWILEADEPADAIIEQSEQYDLTVIGAPTTSRLRQFVSGSRSRTIASDARSGVVVVRNGPLTPGESTA